VSGPLVVATCSEFAVLLVARYAEGRAAGLAPEQSTRLAAQRTGRAFFTSALTTLGGFAVLMFSTLPLLGDFGVVVTINIAVALLSALVVVPPLLQEADRRGLLVLDQRAGDDRARDPRRRRATGLISGVLLAVGGLALAAIAVSGSEPVAAKPLTSDAAEAPATLPPPTTVPPTTVPPTTLVPPSTQPGDTTASTEPTTLPPGPAERPAGLVAGAFWDGLVAVGVDPGVARCAADDLVATTSEADLLAMGVASVPRPPEVNALLDAAAKRCGVTQEQLDAAAASSGG
jgi:hypothetical protein